MSVRFSILAMEGCWTFSTSASIFCDRPRAWRSSLSGISASIASALDSARCCAWGDMRERSLENLLAISQPFLSKLLQVFVVELIGDGDVHLVPPVVPRLVPANQQDRRPPRIKRVQDSKWPATVLCAQFTHVTVPRSLDPAAVRKT